MICVCEDHAQDDSEPEIYLAAVGLDGTAIVDRLVFGNDFYSAPRVSPDGSQLAWLTWNHPDMPWDRTELWIGQIKEDGSIGSRSLIAGGSDDVISQSRFSPDGKIYFLAEKTGWLNLNRWTAGHAEAQVRFTLRGANSRTLSWPAGRISGALANSPC